MKYRRRAIRPYSTTTKWIPIILVAAILTLGLYLASVSSTFKPTPDSCEYVGLGRSLAYGLGYQFNGLAGSTYPPLLPFSLAGLNLASDALGTPLTWTTWVTWAKLLQVALAVLFALGAWRLARRYLDERPAQLVALLTLANISLLQHCMFITSDVMYGCLSIWALVLLQNAPRFPRWAGGVLLVMLAWFTRSAGLVLAAAIFISLLFPGSNQLSLKSRIRRALVTPVLCALPFVLWQLSHPTQQQSITYLKWWTQSVADTNAMQIIERSFQHIGSVVIFRISQLLLNVENLTLPVSFTLVIFLLPAWGWCHRFRKHRTLCEWYALGYFTLLSLWHADQGTRFSLPLLPLLLLYTFVGLNRMRQLLTQSTRSAKILRFFVLVTLAGLTLPLLYYLFQQRRPPEPMLLLRNGYFYCILAAFIFILLIFTRSGSLPGRILPVAILISYLALAWLYAAGYTLLEHRLITTRPPLLAGYHPYWQMGHWLGQHNDATEPILCANIAIVHLAAGKITREPDRDMEKTWHAIKQNEFSHLAWLEHPPDSSVPRNEQNEQIRTLVEQHPGHFHHLLSTGSDPAFHLYKCRNPKDD